MSEVFDLYSPVIDADPFPYYAQLREHHPCYWSPKANIWILSRYEDVSRAAQDWETYSSSQGNLIANQAAAGSDWEKFIIATNQLDAGQLPFQAMLEHYTAQGVSVERGFRFLKDPLFFAHSPSRTPHTQLCICCCKLLRKHLVVLLYQIKLKDHRARARE